MTRTKVKRDCEGIACVVDKVSLSIENKESEKREPKI